MKKLISILTVLCMLVSAMPAFAFFADNVAIPETGVLCYYDFENFTPSSSTNIAFSEQSNYGGKMYYANGYVLEADSNKYFIHSGANFAYGVRERVNGNKDAISSGVLKLEYKVKIPTPTSAQYADIFYVTYNPAEGDGARAYLNTPAATADGAVIHFANALHDGAKVLASENAVTKEVNYDQWYTITMILDYDNNKVFQYLDGERVAAYIQTEENFNKFHSFNYGALSTGKYASTTSEYIQIDNFLVERLDVADVTAKVVNVGENYVDIEFDASLIANDSFIPENFSLKKLDVSDAVNAQSVTATEVDKIRVTFADDFAAGANYEIIVNADVVEAGTSNKMAKGTKIFFGTPVAVTEKTILNYDFYFDFPTSENSATFENFYYQGVSSSDTSSDFITQKELTYNYTGRTAGNPGGDGGTANQRVFALYTPQDGHPSIVFPFDESVSNGLLTVEFEALIPTYDNGGTAAITTGWFEAAFGLHDKLATPATKYDYKTAWADSTVFAGLTYWSGRDKVYSPSSPVNRCRPATWYDDIAQGNKMSDWKDTYNAGIVSTANSDRINVFDKYKIVVDLENDIFELYLNGVKKFTSDYMPGSVDSGEYDAFVLTTTTRTSALGGRIFLDNLKVTHKVLPVEPLKVNSAAFEVGGKKVAYNENVDFEANKMTIKMSEELGDVDGRVTVNTDEDYTVAASGDVITIEFPNGLTYDKDYTVTLDGAIAAASGAALGTDLQLTFKTVAGEITYENVTVSVEDPAEVVVGSAIIATVNAKAGVPCTATIIIAGYKGDTLADVAHGVITDSDGTLEFEYSASEAFAGSDVIKVFVFDNLTDVTPYVANLTIGE